MKLAIFRVLTDVFGKRRLETICMGGIEDRAFLEEIAERWEKAAVERWEKIGGHKPSYEIKADPRF